MVNRCPISDNIFEDYLFVLVSVTNKYGVLSDRDVSERFNLLVEELQRKIFNCKSPKKKTVSGIFIKIFKAKYFEQIKSKYPQIKPREAGLVVSLTSELRSIYYDVDEYLDWFFDEFMPDNEKLNPSTISLACSDPIFSKFKYDHKAEIENRKEMALKAREEDDVMEKFNKLYRETKDEELEDMLRRYNHDGLGVMKFKEEVDAFERKFNKNGSKEGVKKR